MASLRVSDQVDLGTRTVKELVNQYIWENVVRAVMLHSIYYIFLLLQILTINLSLQKQRFYCTVTITELVAGERWWFSACTTCNKGTNTNPYVPGFKCPDKHSQWRGRDAKVLQHS
jgi:hypothetical protein